MLYQFLPRLSDDEYTALEASIRAHGIQVPVIVDEEGSIIDGHHRNEIAGRLGIELPEVVRSGLSEAEKRTLALSLNVDRRHLNREQKRALVEASIAADPDLSDRAHAKRTGTSPTTVGTIRSQVSNLDTSPSVSTAPEAAEPPTVVAGPVEPSPEVPRPATDPNIWVEPSTGEVIETPVTVTETHTVKTVTGLDGKTYTTTPSKPKRRSLVDDAYKANTDLWKAIERVRAIRSDDRFARNKADIQAALQPSADLAIEVLQDLFK